MTVVDVEQGSPAWHDWRRTVAGASEAPVIMGVAPRYWTTRTWADLRTVKAEGTAPAANAAQQHGHQKEPLARALLIREQPAPWEPRCVEWNGFGASLDAHAAAHGFERTIHSVTEIKCPVSGMDGVIFTGLEAYNREPIVSHLPPYLFWQCVHQGAVLTDGYTSGDELALSILAYVDDDTYALVPVETRQLKAAWPALEAAWTRFLAGEEQRPVSDAWLNAARDWREKKAEYDDAKAALDQAKAVLCEIGDGEGAGVIVSSRTRPGSVDYKAALYAVGAAQHLDLAPYQEQFQKPAGEPYWDVRLEKKKEAEES